MKTQQSGEPDRYAFPYPPRYALLSGITPVVGCVPLGLRGILGNLLIFNKKRPFFYLFASCSWEGVQIPVCMLLKTDWDGVSMPGHFDFA